MPIRFRWSRKIDPFILKSLAVDLMIFLGVHHSWTNLGYLILVWISLRIWTFRGKRLLSYGPYLDSSTWWVGKLEAREEARLLARPIPQEYDAFHGF